MTPITSSSPTPVAHTLRRRRGLTEEAAAAAVDRLVAAVEALRTGT